MNSDEHTRELKIQDLIVQFNTGKRSEVHAVSGVSFEVIKGETFGLVGESGCGKSSIARGIIQLPRPTSGKVFFQGDDLTKVGRKALRQIRPQIQMVFQDSISALNPRRKVGDTIAMPLKVNRVGRPADRLSKVLNMMLAVGLSPETYKRRPFELSGGQCQRVQIARALITKPALLICDEPVSSLDVSVQAQIINLLEKLKAQYELTILFISHDMSVIKSVCDRVAVMYLGNLCEISPTEKLYKMPAHPYTALLISAIPSRNQKYQRKTVILKNSEIPLPINPPLGCRFHTRCPVVQPLCCETEPTLKQIESGRMVSCHYPLKIRL